MLTDAEVEVLPARVISLEISCALIRQNSLVRWSKIRRPSEKPGNVLSQNVQRFARGVPSRKALRISWEDGKVFVPTRGKFTSLH